MSITSKVNESVNFIFADNMPLIIKCNVQVENRDSYFKNQWWNHRRQQKKNVMTDASLVGTNIGGFSAVQVKNF